MCEEREVRRLDPNRFKQLAENAPKFVDKPPEILEAGDMKIYGQRLNGKLLVLSKSEATRFQCDKPWACISIGVEKGDWPKINKVQQVDLLQLFFYDTEFKREDVKCIGQEDADLILDFMQKNWDNVEYIMVHCLAGMSRSPGVAAAISRIKYGNDDFYFKNYLPNTMVYRTILNLAHERGMI